MKYIVSSLSARRRTVRRRRPLPAEYGWGPAFTEYAAKIAVEFAGAQQEGEALWVAECGGRLIGSVMLCQSGEAGEGRFGCF